MRPRYAHAILDRDGTLNHEADGGWVKQPSAWRWEDGAREALVRLSRAGLRLSVVTNQSCVGRGLVPAATVAAVNEHARADALAAGARIAAFHVCPHVDADDCRCRKPRPGLVEEAVRTSEIPAGSSIVIGDSLRDLEAATAAGVHAVLVRTGHGARDATAAERAGFAVFRDLPAAVDYVLAAAPRPASSRRA